MTKLPVIKAFEIIRVLNKEGFVKFHQSGSHAQFRHPDGRRVTVSVHPRLDIGRGTLSGILRQAEIPREKFLKLLKDP